MRRPVGSLDPVDQMERAESPQESVRHERLQENSKETCQTGT